MIGAGTALYGIWGHPVAHSLSPLLHNTAFADHGIDAAYLAFDVDPGRLAYAAAGARALGLHGFNVTIPHKQNIMALLDELDTGAEKIGAVNTVINRNGRLVGHNTDAAGFYTPLNTRLGFDAKGARAVLLGSGGAARAVAWQLAQAGVTHLLLANRTVRKAEELAEYLNREFGSLEITVASLNEPFTHPDLGQVDLLVQCTSRGLNDVPLALDWSTLHPNAIVADLVYSKNTDGGAFLQQANAHGHRVYEGIWMLLGQAAEAFHLWTGKRMDIERMYNVITTPSASV